MSEELRRRAAALPVSDLCDGAAERRIVTGLVRLGGDGTMAGWARTARAVPGDAAAVHMAVCAAGPGDVVVVDYGGPDVAAGGIGDLVAREARRRGVAGIVLWGPARDSSALRRLGLPLFATGLHPAAGHHDDPGEQGAQVRLGGVDVAPGELVVADDDGVVVIPAGVAESAVAAAERQCQLDRQIAVSIDAGTPLHEVPELTRYLDAVDDRTARRGDATR